MSNFPGAKKPKSGEVECRSVLGEVKIIESEKREGEDSTTSPVISGHGAVFNTASTGLFFEEIITDTAFNGSDMSRCICLFNHDENMILGSVRAGSLSLNVDSRGLAYSCKPHDTQVIREQVLTPMRSGDVGYSSFRFILANGEDADEWYYDEPRDVVVRKIHNISSVLDVSPVLFPAYDAAESTLRNAEKIKAVMPKALQAEARARFDRLSHLFMNSR